MNQLLKTFREFATIDLDQSLFPAPYNGVSGEPNFFSDYVVVQHQDGAIEKLKNLVH